MIEVLPGPPETRAESDEHNEAAAAEDADDAEDADELETVTTDAREQSSEPERAQQLQMPPPRLLVLTARETTTLAHVALGGEDRRARACVGTPPLFRR
jgi:hypothetical protein